ncbi:MAG: hypothetical protein GEU86_13150 [Actinophytocola sp.]|nr:hypothetical protein [Actinophytocola sp.]
MGKRIASLQDRVRGVWFAADAGPDTLLERSFRDCDACGESVYVLASNCRECGAEVELLAG